jgi:LPS sulfotransferase NodH
MTKFIILTSARSGTHMLRSSLLAHPDIVVQHELFNEAMGALHPYTMTESAANIIEHYAFKGGGENIKARGFPLLEEQASAHKGKQWQDVWKIIKEMEDIKIIHLSRRNLLRRIISHANARDTQQWTLYPNNKAKIKNTTFTIEIDHLQKNFEMMAKRYQQANDIFSGHKMIDICYEDLCNGLEQEMKKKILPFLEVPFVQIHPATRKNPEKNMIDIVSNYSELKQHFKDTKWAKFFDE